MKNKTKKQRKIEKSRKLKNKKLIKNYPFLCPLNYSGHRIKSKCTFTEFDFLPKGWKKAFGKQLLEDIKKELNEINFSRNYMVYEVKEKYGGLRWYDNCALKCIKKYEDLSYTTCIVCGKPATLISTGWICPYCEKCAKKYKGKYVSLNDFYGVKNEG